MTDQSWAPLLTVPTVVFPGQRIPHADVIRIVREQYAPARARHPGDAAARRAYDREVERGLKMAGHLKVDQHPVHLTPAQLSPPRGFGDRNDQARDAFSTYVPPAARQALAAAALSSQDVDAVLVTTSTVLGMPSTAHDTIEMLGLRPDVEFLPYWGLGCNGGAHAVARARDYILAHPDHTLLLVAADYASPWFFVEEDQQGTLLRGSVLSSCLFADGTAAAVMAADLPVPGFRILQAGSVTVPGTQDALAFRILNDGLHFTLTDRAPQLVPGILKSFESLLAGQGLSPADLAACTFHTGGNRIIDNLQEGLGLSPHQVKPTWQALLNGNTMSVATLDAMRIVGTDDQFRPQHGGRGVGAGFGPGFSSTYLGWSWDAGRGHGRQPAGQDRLAAAPAYAAG